MSAGEIFGQLYVRNCPYRARLRPLKDRGPSSWEQWLSLSAAFGMKYFRSQN